MQTANYKINYYGKLIKIQNTKKVLALFVSGSGYTFSDGYEGNESYRLLMANPKDFGETLIEIGFAYTRISGDEIETRYNLNGVDYDVKGFGTTDLFMKIQEAENE